MQNVEEYNQWLRDSLADRDVTPEHLRYRPCAFCGKLYRPKKNYPYCSRECGKQARKPPKEPKPETVQVDSYEDDDWGVWDEW